MAVAQFYRQLAGLGANNNSQNGAKVREKVAQRPLEGVAARRFYSNKSTFVLFKFAAVLSMILKYAKPLLLSATCEKSGDVASGTFLK